MNARKILLFDIDGTLVDCGGAGRKAMEGAFGERMGRADALDGVVFGGMTDPAIIREGLRRIDHPADASLVAELLEKYLEVLARELPLSPRFRVIEHAVAAVERAEKANHSIGLGTGNLRRGAAIKLEFAGIHQRFAFGGFSCDDEDRPTLIRIARDRGHHHAHRHLPEVERPPIGAVEVVVIGDTPRDVAAAKAIGATCLAVATGRFTEAQLRESGAEWTVPHLGADLAIEMLS